MSIRRLIKAYTKHFGCKPSEVISEPLLDGPNVPPISVCLFPKKKTGLPHDVLITAGMSLREMAFPESYSSEKWSNELILYVDKPQKEDFRWLRWVAELPFFDSFVIGYGHTVWFPDSLYQNSKSNLSKFLLIETLMRRDRGILASCRHTAFPCEVLWLVPITEAEYNLKLESGIGAVLTMFEKHQHPIVLNRERSCYATGI